MARLRRYITKKTPSDPWVITTESSYRDLHYSPEEISSIIEPCQAFEDALTGYDPTKSRSWFAGDNYVTERYFDTREHAEAALSALTDMSNPLILNRKNLVASRVAEVITGSYEYEFEILD